MCVNPMLTDTESIDLNALASSLTTGFIRGEYKEDCSATLNTLLPGVSSMSISVVTGDKVMVTEENLLRPGFASLHFDRLDETVGGQALLSGKVFEAKHPGPRAYADLDRAHSTEGCTMLVSQPILRPTSDGLYRRSSFGSDTTRPSFSAAARMSARSSSGAITQDDCVEHFGALSQRRKQAGMGCISIGLPEDAQPSMGHRNSLRLLAGILAPILAQQSLTFLDGLKTAFGPGRLDGMLEGTFPTATAGVEYPISRASTAQDSERWSGENVDDMVDSLMHRGSPGGSSS